MVSSPSQDGIPLKCKAEQTDNIAFYCRFLKPLFWLTWKKASRIFSNWAPIVIIFSEEISFLRPHQQHRWYQGGNMCCSASRQGPHTSAATFLSLTLYYLSKINSYLYPEGFFTLKKTPWYVIRGHCCPSSGVWQPSADSNGSLAPFLYEFKLSGLGVTAPADNNDAPKGNYYLQRAVTPDQITKEQESPKGRKGTLRLD
jgi:hypothetical protein